MGKLLTTYLLSVIFILFSNTIQAQSHLEREAIKVDVTHAIPPITYAESYTPVSLEMEREMKEGASNAPRIPSDNPRVRPDYDRSIDFPKVYREGIEEIHVTWMDEERLSSRAEAETIIRDILTEVPDNFWSTQIDSVFFGGGSSLIAMDTKGADGVVGRLIIFYNWPEVKSLYSNGRGMYRYSSRRHEEVFRLSTYQLEYLIARISVGDSHSRESMIRRLASVGRNQPEAGLALIPLLNAPNPNVRNLVPGALARVNAPQGKILDALLMKIDYAFDSTRHIYISPLGAFPKQSKRLSPVLIRLLQYPDSATRLTAAVSLRTMDKYADKGTFSDTVDGLIEAYDTGDEKLRSEVIYTLASYSVTKGYPVPTAKIKATLKRALSDTNKDIRKYAANRLRQIDKIQ